jgi:TRAP-type mannitol/chloroaromatic compound transport system substrate-binding protein
VGLCLKSRYGVTQVALCGALLSFGLAVHAQAPASKTLTMQASWPASSMFMDNFNQFADRVNKTTGGRLQIKTSAAGTIVRRSR